MLANKLILWPLPLIAVSILGTLNPILITVTVLLSLIPLLKILKSPKKTTIVGAPLSVFTFSTFIGLWAAYDPALSLPLVLTVFGSLILFFSMVYANQSAVIVAKSLVLMAGLIAIYFVSQYAHLHYPNEISSMAEIARLTSSKFPDLVFFTPPPNAIAGMVSSTILLALVLARQANYRWQRLGWGAIIVVMGYALLITGSRGAWIGLASATVIWLGLLYLSQRALHLLGLGAGILAGLLLGGYILAQTMPATTYGKLTESFLATGVSRSTLYYNSLNLFWDYPFTGIGPGDTFAMIYSQYQLLIHVLYLEYAHNLFLSVAVGQGIVGLIALVWLICKWYIFVFQAERSIPTNQIPSLFRAAWLGVTVIFIHGLTDSVQFSQARWTTPTLFILLALAVTAIKPLLSPQANLQQSRPVLLLPPWAKPALAGGAIALIFVGVLIFRQPLISAGYANLGAVYQAQADLSPNLSDTQRQEANGRAKNYFNQALAVNSQNATAHRRLGMIALSASDFETAISHLEQAFWQEPANQATLKALGYAYLWTGQIDSAQQLLEQVDFQTGLIQELEYWQWQWGVREQDVQVEYTTEMLERLKSG